MDYKDKYIKYKTKYLHLKNIVNQIGSSRDKYVIILFNGFLSSNLWWNYTINDNRKLKKINFLKKLKNIGETFKFNQPFFNVIYYKTPNNKEEKLQKIDEKYKEFSSDVNFLLEDLDYKNICTNIYNTVKNKYGNNKKYIVIGHSYGGTLALLFSKLYKDECVLCCCIDNPPYVMDFYKKFDDREYITYKGGQDKYTNNSELKKSLNIIENSSDHKIKNKEIDDIIKLMHCRMSEDNIKYHDKKLYVPTLFFKRLPSNPKGGDVDWIKFSKKEQQLFKNDKNMKNYIFMKDADHIIWKNQEYSDIIIDNIKNMLK